MIISIEKKINMNIANISMIITTMEANGVNGAPLLDFTRPGQGAHIRKGPTQKGTSGVE